ncbi:hypothetical protein HYS84_02045 [Candidatus Saccharibacteria bacterium]|nr:hypothetical protein [Candidatus Saccharibacteria bacterium]
MRKIKKALTVKSILLILFGSLALAAVPALAESGSSDDNQQSETAKKAAEAKLEAAKQEFEKKREAAKQEFEAKREAAKQEFEAKREAAKNNLEVAKDRLEENKLRICQEHEDKINNHMDAIAERGQKKIDLFSTIADRTKTFYLSKGKVLSNYDELVAAVDAKKATAQAVVDAVISSSVTFDCEGDDPKGAASEFKTDVKAMNSALKEFKTAVKNLIVGVKSVQSTEGED